MADIAAADFLNVHELSVSFGTQSGVARVLDRVSLSMRPGEIMGLVGESGCGKTTLARAILGVLPAECIDRHRRHRVRRPLPAPAPAPRPTVRGRAITFVPQDPFGSFSPLFTVGDQIAELLRWKSPDIALGNGAARRRARPGPHALRLLQQVQLPDPERLLQKYPHELSGGQRQRVMIAMALLPEPKLVIADEPTTALDVTIQAQILKLLRRLATERGACVLFTTHDLGTAWEICDRVTVMYAGQEAETAEVTTFFNEPSHPYTCMLLDSLPMQGAALRGIPGDVPSPYNPPTGCRFHPRCPHATEICRDHHRAPLEISPAHFVRCHHPRAPA